MIYPMRSVQATQATDLSIILPVKNEEENIPLMHQQLKQALDALGRSYEIIYVDDGSTDGSYRQLSLIVNDDPNVAVIRFRRNYGQTAAIAAGLDYSRGDVVILMDADLQNDPGDIARLLEKLDEGYDVVSGWRARRKDKFLTRRVPSMVANRLISAVTGVHLHDYGCTLKAYRREVLEPVRLYGEMHRFLPVYAYWSGARIAELRVNHHSRRYGKSKYGLNRTLRVVMDLVTVKFLGSYSTKPLYMFGRLGILLFLGSLLTEGVAVAQRFLPPFVRMHNNPLTLFGAVLVVLATQFIMLGLLAELQMRTYYESQGKPTYTLRSVVIGTPRGPVTVPQTPRKQRYSLESLDLALDVQEEQQIC